MQHPFARPRERDEAERLVEAHSFALRVRDHSDATQAVALLERETKHVAKQSLANAEALRSRVHSETGETQHGKGILGQPAP